MIQKISFALAILFAMATSLIAENIPDPCKLLTLEEVESVMQLPMKPGRLKDNRTTFNGLNCSYASIDQFEKSGNVSITINTTADMKKSDSIFGSAKEMYDKKRYAYREALKRRNEADTFQEIKGLGSDAYWNGTSLNILNSDTTVTIRVSGGFGLSAHNSQELDKKVEAKKLGISKEIAQSVLEGLEQKK